MKTLIALTFIFSALAAHAGTETCSNSNQTLIYTHRTSTPTEITTLKYEQYTQGNEKPIDFKLSKIEIKEQKPSGSSLLKTSTAFAQGSIQGEGQTISFHDWVVCTELTSNTVAQK